MSFRALLILRSEPFMRKIEDREVAVLLMDTQASARDAWRFVWGRADRS